MVDLNKAYNESRISEDAVVAGDAAAPCDVVSGGNDVNQDIVQNDGAISDTDVLGKCDHNKHGFFSTGCFHIPKNVLKELPSKQKKKHKNPYAKGKIMIISEVDSKKEKAIKKIIDFNAVKQNDLQNFINRNYNFPADKSAQDVKALLYCKGLDEDVDILIKVRLDNGAIMFVPAKVDEDYILVANGHEPLTEQQAQTKYGDKVKNSKNTIGMKICLVTEDSKTFPYTINDILNKLENVPEKYYKSQIHIGPAGRHIGDVEKIVDNGKSIDLVIKKAHVETQRGPVAGCMSVEDFINALTDIQIKDPAKDIDVYAVEPLDPISKQLGRKQIKMQIVNVDIAKIDGVWLRVQ